MAQEPQAEDRSEGRQLSRMDLLAKYRDAVRKYDELVRRYTEDSSERSSAVTLALAALRVSRSGLALFGKRGFLNRNDEWLALARQAEPWRNADGPNDAAHASLESAAEQLARPLLTRKPDVPMRLARFFRSSPEQIVELRLEAVLARDQPLVIAIAEDVTERVRADRELARTRETAAARDRMGLLGELASGVAHDLNNTLHALSLRIGHLQSTDLDEGQRTTPTSSPAS